MKFEHDGETMTIVRREYVDGRSTCLRIVDSDGVPYATLTVSIGGVALEGDEVLIKTWSENASVAASCKHLFIDTGQRVPTGYCVAEIWKIA